MKEVRHMLVSRNLLKEINGSLKPISSVRTLLTHSSTLLTHSEGKDLMKMKSMSLRALQLQVGCPSVIHNKLINTIHLRYLDISYSNIIRLPDSICLLFNLLSLRLDNCDELQYLPESMAASLRKLIHICLFGCHKLECMPPKIGLLHNLHTLTKFIVGIGDGFGIKELKDLRYLGNRLELYNLRNVKSGSKANLHEKQNLSELLLCWGRHECETPTNIDASNEEQVLQSLAPHPQGELKHLEVHGYGGVAIPQWMKDPRIFLALRELIISCCPRCVDIPIVWSFPCLVRLSLSNMDNLTTLCRNFDVETVGHNTPLQILPMLKRMELMYLPELKRWVENSAGEINNSMMFPQLEELKISNCDKLASLPEMPVLRDLNLCCRTPDGQPIRSQRPLDTLRSLHLKGDDSFASVFNKSKLQLGFLDCMVSVEQLFIDSCFNIVRWPVEELRCLPRLRHLYVWRCSRLEGKGSSLEEEDILPLPQLETLQISSCDSLLQIPKLPASLERIEIWFNGSLEALPSNLGGLSKLKRLFVQRCGALKALPDGMDDLTSLEQLDINCCPGIEKFPHGLLQRLPALKSLCIWYCPDLQRRCREGGEYFNLVAPIPEKRIPEPAPEMKKPVKWFLPPCAGGSNQGN